MAARTMLRLNNPIFVISDEWNYFARFVKIGALNKTIAPVKINCSDIWIEKWPEYTSIPLKYKYLGLLKKTIIKIYLLLWR